MVATNAKGIQLGANYLKESNRIALIGTGGNLAIAQHMASDIYRHTNKFCFAPDAINTTALGCLLYTSPSPRDGCRSRMPSSA